MADEKEFIGDTFIDIDHRIIPDRFSLGLIVTGFILSLFDPMMSWLDSTAGIVIGGGVIGTPPWMNPSPRLNGWTGI